MGYIIRLLTSKTTGHSILYVARPLVTFSANRVTIPKFDIVYVSSWVVRSGALGDIT
jgi:hypothetical protein